MSFQPAPDRRSHPRYLCWVEALCATPDNAPQPARLLDLSVSGARVALLRPLPAGVDLRLVLPRGEERPSILCGSISRVARTRTGWEAGCTFAEPLTEDELAGLLQLIEVS
jgi:hypothetical protein